MEQLVEDDRGPMRNDDTPTCESNDPHDDTSANYVLWDGNSDGG